MSYKKKILLYSNNDKVFSSKIVNFIVKEFPKFNYDIIFSKQKISKKIKILLCILFYSKINNLISFILSKEIFSEKLNIISKIEDNPIYDFAISVNYQNKINPICDTYNFHLGNLSNQRGVFIFYYKFIYKWKQIALTFHKIDNHFDKGEIINMRNFNVKNLDSVEIMKIYENNLDFVKESFKKISNSKVIKKKITHYKINKTPSITFILKNIIKKYFS